MPGRGALRRAVSRQLPEMIRSVVAVRHVDPPPSGEPHPAAPGPVVARWTRRSTQTPLRTAIQHGRLTAGTLLPPSRILTEQLGGVPELVSFPARRMAAPLSRHSAKPRTTKCPTPLRWERLRYARPSRPHCARPGRPYPPPVKARSGLPVRPALSRFSRDFRTGSDLAGQD
jgi:hypothetical protein